jgi:hypothetical protein
MLSFDPNQTAHFNNNPPPPFRNCEVEVIYRTKTGNGYVYLKVHPESLHCYVKHQWWIAFVLQMSSLRHFCRAGTLGSDQLCNMYHTINIISLQSIHRLWHNQSPSFNILFYNMNFISYILSRKKLLFRGNRELAQEAVTYLLLKENRFRNS